MESTASIVSKFLIDKGLAEDVESTTPVVWPVFVSFLPEAGNDVVGVFDTAGNLDGRLMATGRVVEKYGLQVIVRSFDFPAGYAKIRNIAKELDAVKGVEIKLDEVPFVVQNFSRQSAVLSMGNEEAAGSRRHLFSVNYAVTFKRTSIYVLLESLGSTVQEFIDAAGQYNVLINETLPTALPN